MNIRIVVIVMTLLLQACGTASTYEPKEYPLKDESIKSLQVTGSINVINVQDSSVPLIVYARNSTTTLSSDLKTITETMTKITKRELSKNSVIKQEGKEKTIELKVTSLLSNRMMMSSTWESVLVFQAKLGNGVVIENTAKYSTYSSIGSLNGNIVEGVIVLLNDPRVRAYLKQ